MGEKFTRCALLGVAAAWLFAPVSMAQCLGFQDILDSAANNDPGVQIAQADLENAEAGLQEARSLYQPQISTFGRVGIGDNGLIDSQIENQVGLRASQRIIDFGDARLARRASREEVRAQEHFVLSAKGTAALEAGLAYLDWLQFSAQLDATEGRAAFFAQQLNAVEALLEEGGSTLIDQAEVAAELATADAERFEFQFQRDRAATQVAIATNRNVPLCRVTDEMNLGLDIAGLDAPSALDHLTELALISNARIEALRRSTLGLDAAAKREARGRLPIIDVVGISTFASEEIFDDFDFENRVGLDVSVPIFTGNALTARRRQSRARAARSAGELAAARRTLREDVALAFRRALLLEAQLIRRAEIERLKAAQFEASEIEYDRGLRTLPDLIDIRLELEEAALDEIAARFSLAREKLRLRALTGQLPLIMASDP